MRLHPLIRRLAPPLILGLITTLAVSWSFAAFAGWHDPRTGTAILAPRGSNVSNVVVHQASQPGMLLRQVVIITQDEPLATAQTTSLPYSENESEVFGPDDVDDSWGLVRRALVLRDQTGGVERAFGWPLPAAYWRHDADGTPTGGSQLRLSSDEPWSKGDRFLPTLPIWRGVLLNSMLFASTWSLVLAIPHFARRAHRRRRGGCPACGYSLAQLAICPECGWTANRPKSSTPTDP